MNSIRNWLGVRLGVYQCMAQRPVPEEKNWSGSICKASKSSVSEELRRWNDKEKVTNKV